MTASGAEPLPSFPPPERGRVASEASRVGVKASAFTVARMTPTPILAPLGSTLPLAGGGKRPATTPN